MNIFQYLNSLLFSKKKADMNRDDESQFNMFMINRWSSMYSKEMNNYINESSNKYWNLFDEKDEQYNFLYYLLPKLKFKRINYIKKLKKEKKQKEEKYYIPEFYSEREYKQLLDMSDTLSK
jgi:hypothetical protein